MHHSAAKGCGSAMNAPSGCRSLAFSPTRRRVLKPHFTAWPPNAIQVLLPLLWLGLIEPEPDSPAGTATSRLDVSRGEGREPGEGDPHGT